MLVRALSIIPGICLLLVAGYQAVRAAYAEHLFISSSVESVREAIRLAPGRALYRVGLAELLDRAGQDARPPLQAAAALKPGDASIWIRLGLLEEIGNQFQKAEEDLLRAARVSRKHDPRWTLANYYYRREQPDEFWQWAREALLISYGDRTPLFRLCWNMSPDPDTILRRAVPERRPVLMDYASFLAALQEYSAAEHLFGELAAGAEDHEVGYFLAITDRLLELGRMPAALAVWNSLCRRGLVRYPPLAPETGVVLTNGSFAARTLAHGFDWRIPSLPGVFVAQMPPPAGWRISLSGNQPERCVILSQFLPLEAGRNYRLRFRYRSAAAAAFRNPNTGIRWRLYNTGSSGGAIAQSEPLAGDGAGEDGFDFTLPAGGGARLALVYERASGTTRTEGAVTMEYVSVCLAE